MEGGGRRVWMTEEEFDVFSTLKQLESASLERRGLNLCSTNMVGQILPGRAEQRATKPSLY